MHGVDLEIARKMILHQLQQLLLVGNKLVVLLILQLKKVLVPPERAVRQLLELDALRVHWLPLVRHVLLLGAADQIGHAFARFYFFA